MVGLSCIMYGLATTTGSSGMKAPSIWTFSGALLAVTCHPFSGLAAFAIGVTSILLVGCGLRRLRTFCVALLAGGAIGTTLLLLCLMLIPGVQEQFRANVEHAEKLLE